MGKNKQRLVLYHGACPDGFTAAWACWMRFGSIGTEYRPIHYQAHTKLPVVGGRDVIMVDFSLPRPVMQQWIGAAASLICLDHHLSAQAELADLPGCEFDMHRSGAGMAWDYFHGTATRPWMIDYIEGRDLWTWPHPDNEAICDGLDLFDREFDIYQTLALGHGELKLPTTGTCVSVDNGSDGLELCRSFGQPITAYKRVQVERSCRKARTVIIGGHAVPTVNSSLFQSEIGNTLMLRTNPPPFAAVWFRRKDGMFKYSLRSADDAVDVSIVAKQYGGGGHRNAAAFTVDHEVDAEC